MRVNLPILIYKDWRPGLAWGIGDWGFGDSNPQSPIPGIGDWGFGIRIREYPIPNPKSPKPGLVSSGW